MVQLLSWLLRYGANFASEVDKQKRSGSGRPAGGSIFGSAPAAIHPDLTPLVAPLSTLTKSNFSSKTSVANANSDYEKQTDPAAVIPSAPVYAARLNGLLKTLASAEGAVAERIKARTTLIEGLEKLLTTHRAELAEEEDQVFILAERKQAIDSKKREVEDSIMRGFANSNPNTPTQPSGSPGTNATPNTPGAEPDRPKVEELTPPPFESLTPVGSPNRENGDEDTDMTLSAGNAKNEDAVAQNWNSVLANSNSSPQPGYGSSHTGVLKKRKLTGDDDFPDFGADDNLGLDPETAQMLKDVSG